MARRFTVSWYGVCPIDENGDRDHDSTPHYAKSFATYALAEGYARKKAEESDYGEAGIREERTITPAELDADDDLDFYIEKGLIWSTVGREVTVEALKR